MPSRRSCYIILVTFVRLSWILGGLALRPDWRDFIDRDLYKKYVGKTASQFNRSFFQGDIDKVDRDVSGQEVGMAFNAIKDAKYRWTDATVPFTISSTFSDDEQMRIRDAITAITELTNDCVRFTDRVTEVDYIKIVRGLSGVGRQGGAQQVSFTTGCFEEQGDVQHEILHALGFYHEHTREDRDQYVTINWRNIREDDKTQFQKFDGFTFNLPYDYSSVMHYPWNAFPMNPSLPTMIPNEKLAKIGQRANLSLLDAQRIRKAYGCDETDRTTRTDNMEVTTTMTTTTTEEMTTVTTIELTTEETTASQPTSVPPSGQADHFQGITFTQAVACVQSKSFYRNPQRARATPQDLLADCHSYYGCTDGTVFHLSCPPGTYFNVISQNCEDDVVMTADNCAFDNSDNIADAKNLETKTSAATEVTTQMLSQRKIHIRETTPKPSDLTLPNFKNESLSVWECIALGTENCWVWSYCVGFLFYCSGSTDVALRNHLEKIKLAIPSSPIHLKIGWKKELKPETFQSVSDNIVIFEIGSTGGFNCDVLRDLPLPNLLELHFDESSDVTINRDSLKPFRKMRLLVFEHSTILSLEIGSLESLISLKTIVFDWKIFLPFASYERSYLWRIHCSAEYSWLREYLGQHPELTQPRKPGEVYSLPGMANSEITRRQISYPVDCSKDDLTGSHNQVEFSLNDHS